MARRNQVHIIDSLDCAATLCGRWLETMPKPDDLTPQAMFVGHDVAIWEDADWPPSYAICLDCQRAYG